jgi:hypothetical protein
VLLAAAIGGCTTRITYRYDEATPPLKAVAGTTVNLAVLDRRTYVVNRQKPPTFVGVSRTSFDDYVNSSEDAAKKMFDVTTASGKPLADDFAKTIATALSAKGVRVSVISLPPEIDEAEAVRRLSDAPGHSMLLVLNEWRTEAQASTYLICDLHAIIIGQGGAILARKRLHGAENLGGNPRNPIAHGREVVPVAYSKKLQELFAAPEIAGQL